MTLPEKYNIVLGPLGLVENWLLGAKRFLQLRRRHLKNKQKEKDTLNKSLI